MTVHADLTVFCLCAAWCRTCDAYADIFKGLSKASRETSRWHWVDIEDQAVAIGDVEVENFPCLLIADDQHVYFFGAVLPNASVTTRLLEHLSDATAKPLADNALEGLRQRLFESLDGVHISKCN